MRLTLEAIKNKLSIVKGEKHGVSTFPQVREIVLELQQIKLVKIKKGTVSLTSSVHMVENADKIMPLLESRLKQLKAASDFAFGHHE